MTGFIIVAALLVVAVIALLLPPLWRAPRASGTADRREANLAVFRDQISELERERNDGLLAEADFVSARNELQRRLLDEVQPATTTPAGNDSGGRKTALALLVIIPLAAAAGYTLLGSPRALDPLQRQARLAPQQIAEMVAGLVEKLRKNPDDSQGWVMLARSYKVMERFPEAAEAYSRAGTLVDQDAALLGDYADVLSRSHGGSLQGKPSELVERALSIDPDEPQALLLAGAAASDRQQFAAAATYWARLLAQLEPGSEEARALEAAIAKAREIAAAQAAGDKPGKIPTDGAGAVSGEVTLSGKLVRDGQTERHVVRLRARGGGSAHAARRHAGDGCRPAAALSLRRLDGIGRRPEDIGLQDSQRRGTHRQGRHGAEFEWRPLRHTQGRQAGQPESAPAHRSGAALMTLIYRIAWRQK